MYRYYGSQTGNIVNLVPGTGTDGLATKDNRAGNAKILLGSSGNTGNVTVNLTGLNTTSVVANGRVRAVVQRIPYNNGAAVTGPTTVSDTDPDRQRQRRPREPAVDRTPRTATP